MNIKTLFVAAAAMAAVVSCVEKAPVLTKSGLNPASFVAERDGKQTALYTLRNDAGMEVCVTNFGGRIVSIMVPDKNGDFIDVVHGFDDIQGYYPENNSNNFGATIGRYANRIAGGTFSIDGKAYQLPKNDNGKNCLHGGTGWHNSVFDCIEADDTHVKLQTVSPDGDNGFPGCVTASVTYTLTQNNAVNIHYEAVTDAPTVINMTNHTYFNLSGDDTDCNIWNDVMTINASNCTPVNTELITSGEIVPVAGTSLDFTSPKRIGDVIEDFENEQIKNAGGIDHNWVLDTKGDINEPAVTVYCPGTGIELTVSTDDPGMQVYSGNFLDGTIKGKKGRSYGKHSSICIESQKYPDTPNKPEWPSAVLRPGETYSANCVFAFSVK